MQGVTQFTPELVLSSSPTFLYYLGDFPHEHTCSQPESRQPDTCTGWSEAGNGAGKGKDCLEMMNAVCVCVCAYVCVYMHTGASTCDT